MKKSTSMKKTTYIYLKMPKHIDDLRGVLPEDDSPAHVTLLYVGPTTKKQFWQIVHALADEEFSAWPTCVTFGALDYFDTRSHPKRSSNYVQYVKVGLAHPPFDTAQHLHESLRRLVLALGPSFPIKHAGDAFTPHLTLKYLSKPPKLPAQKMLKIQSTLSDQSFSINSVYVDWGDAIVARVDNHMVYEERRG